MDVIIDKIQFNHNLSPANTHALTIRKNEQDDIETPEWQWQGNGKAPKVSPVAYARSQGNHLTIAVQLRRLNLNVREVNISAASKSVLGNVIGDKIVFEGKNELSDFKVLKLEARLDAVGVKRLNVSLPWTLIADTGGGKTASSQTTQHLVYTVLLPPVQPWAPSYAGEEYEVPWADVLEKACAWADGATDLTSVASAITKKLYEYGKEGKLTFIKNRTYSQIGYNGTDRFDLTDFLTRLDKPKDTITVNCTDCAVLVSTFANILGCDLYQSQMGPKFKTNLIREIGAQQETKTEFTFHEVAWEYPCKDNAKIFDCFLQIDGDDDPTKDFTPLLPLSIPFGTAKSKDYLFRLVQKGLTCIPFDTHKIRRKIARQRLVVRPLHPELEEFLKREFNFLSSIQLPAHNRVLSGPVARFAVPPAPVGWRVVHSRTLNGEAGVIELSASVWQAMEDDDTAIRLLLYRCASGGDAREFLYSLLGDFQGNEIGAGQERGRNQGNAGLGDLAFSDPEQQVMLFARSNIVVFVQNVKIRSASVSNFARSIDKTIMNALDSEASGQMPNLLNSANQRKEERVMPTDFTNTVWSSIRPSGDVNPADMRRNGVFRIEDYDPETGDVEGMYYDLDYLEDVRFEGSIRYIGGNSYSFLFYHRVPDTDATRYYEGQTVAEVGYVSVLGGQWHNVLPNHGKAPGTNDKEVKDRLPGQDEGVWVATKP